MEGGYKDMSTTVDERVVEMRFDNKQFEANVQTSLSTLEKLKQSLNLEGATKGLENVNATAKRFDMSGVSDAVETVKARFSALEVMGITALANITNSAVNAGKRMIESLTIAPISQGFDEYELKMGSIQTIMMSTGASLEEVNKYLNELNTYSDKTIYSFQDMTSNIGKFTNAGVGLEDAVMAIQGVSNVAAVSGANTNEASRAMYNFAQAMSAGYVKLIDWKSIENANMATVEFKTQLLESAVACGTLTKTADGMYKTVKGNVIDATHGFNDSLQDQWMTTDALVGTLRQYADETTEIGKKAFAAAQDVKTFSQLMDTLKEAVGSGWAMTWEILFGDFEEAKVLWTSLSTTIGGFIDAQSNARNELLKGWKDLGGRAKLIEGLKSAFEGLVSVIKPIKEAFTAMFPAVTAQRIYELTDSFAKFTSKLKLSDTASQNLKDTFSALFGAVELIGEAFGALWNAFAPVRAEAGALLETILGFTGETGRMVTNVEELIREGGLFTTIANGIAAALSAIISGIKMVKQFVSEKLAAVGFETFHALLERVQTRLSQIGSGASDMKSAVTDAFASIGASLANSKFYQMLEAIGKALKTIGGGIVSAFGSAAGSIIDKLSNANFSGIIDLLNGISLSAIAVGITKFLKSAKDLVDTGASIKESIVGILDSVKGCFEAWQQDIKAGTLMKIATAVGILAASLVALSFIDSDKLAASLGAITVLFADLMASMAVFSKIDVMQKGITRSCTAMLAMSIAIGILAGAMVTLGSLDWEGVSRGLVAIAGLSAIVVASSKAMSTGSGQMIKGAGSLILFAGAVKILSSVCAELGGMKWEEMKQGLLGVGVLLAEIDVFLRTAKFGSGAISTAAGIVVLAAAIKILASAVSDLGGMDWENMKQGLLGLGAVLGGLAVFTKFTSGAQNMVGIGAGLILVGASIKIFASAIGDLGSLDPGQLVQGLTGMGVALAEIAIALKVMPKNTIAVGAGLVVVGAALELVADSVGKLAKLTWDQVETSMVTLGIALGELALALNLMNGTLAGSAALLVAAGALAILAPVLSLLGAMSGEAIAKSLITLAGAFTVIGVAGAVLSPVIPAILALSGALALIGVGVLALGTGLLAAGAGISALAVGITALAASLAAGATGIVASLSMIVLGFADLIPAVAVKIAEGVVTFATAIASAAPALIAAATTVILALMQAIQATAPAIMDTVAMLLTQLLSTIASYLPQIIQSGCDIIVNFLQGIRNNIGQIVETAVSVVLEFVNAVAAQIPVVVNAGFDLIINFIDGLGQAIEDNTPRLVEAVVNLGGHIINGLVKGISSGVNTVKDAIVNVAQNAINGFKNFLGINSPSKVFMTLGQYTVDGLINGVQNKLKSAKESMEQLGTTLLNGIRNFLGIHSPSVVFREEVGRYIVQGIAEGIKSDMSAEEAAEQKAKNIVNAFKTELDKLSLDTTTADLEYQLWEKLNPNATSAEKAAMNMSLLANKLELQASRVQLAQGEYQNTLETLGATSEKTQEAYNKLIQEQLSLATLAEELQSAQQTEVERNRTAFQAYADYLNESQDDLLRLGFTMDEIKAAAQERSGWDPNSMASNMDIDVQQVVAAAMGSVQVAYQSNVQSTFSGLITQTTGIGTSMAQGIGTGVQNGTPQAVNSLQTLATTCSAKINEQYPTWVQGGKYLVDGFVQGIRSNIEAAAAAAAEMAMAAYSAAMASIEVASPSKKFAELGMYADLGFAKGLRDYAYRAEKESADMATSSLTGATSIVSKLSDAINGNLDAEPTIRPVLDLSNVEHGATRLSSLLSQSKAATIRIGMAPEEERGTDTADGSRAGNTYTFTQNNYSPKALSRLDIYRQTKNQFSALKGAVSRA